MRIVALIAISVATLTLAACNSKTEEAAPDAASEAVEASGIADHDAVAATQEEAAADAKNAADAAEASMAAQADPAPATPVEGH